MSDDTTTHACPTCSHVHLPPDDGPQMGEPAVVHMVKRAYTSERLFREVWEPQGWKRESLPLGPRLPRCRDVFPGHRNPPPGPPSVPRTCALPERHVGRHADTAGITW